MRTRGTLSDRLGNQKSVVVDQQSPEANRGLERRVVSRIDRGQPTMDQSDRLAKEIMRRYDLIYREVRKSNLQRKSFGQDLRGALRNRSSNAYADSSSAVASAAMAMLAPGLASMAGGAIDEAMRSRQSKVRDMGQGLEKEFVDRMSRNEAVGRISKEYGVSRRDILRALRGQGGRVGPSNARRVPPGARMMPSPMTRGPVMGGFGRGRNRQEIQFNRELINRRIKLESEARKRQERKVPSFFGSLKKTVGGKIRGAMPDLASGLAGGVIGMFAPGLAGPLADMLGEALSAKMERRSEVRRGEEREQEGRSRMAGVRKQLEEEYGGSRYGKKALKQLYAGQDEREKFPILERMKSGKAPFRRRRGRGKGDGMTASVRAFRDTSEATSNAAEPKAIIELMKMGHRDSESLSAKVMRKASATSSLGLNAFRDSSEGMHETVSSTKKFIEVATEEVTRLTTTTIKEIKKLVSRAMNSMGGGEDLLDEAADLLPGGRGGRGGGRTGGGLSSRFLKKRGTTLGRAGLKTRMGVRRLASPSRWKWLSKTAPGISRRLRLNRMGRIGRMGKIGRFGGGGLGLAGGLAAAYGLSHLLPGYSTGSAGADELQGKLGLAEMGTGALSMLGRGGTGLLGKAGRIAGKAALPLQAAMSALDFYGGYVNPEEALGRKKKDELERMSGGGAKMLSGLTMGMIGSKHFGRGGEIIGGKITRGLESVAGKGNLYRMANAATFGAFGNVNEAGTKAKGGIMGKGNYDSATMTRLFGKNWSKDLEKASSDPVKFKAMMDRYNAAMNKASESMEKVFGDKGKVTKTMAEFSNSAGDASNSLKKMDDNIAAVVKEVSPVVSAAPAAVAPAAAPAPAAAQQRASDRTPDAASKRKPRRSGKGGGTPAIQEDMTEVEKLGTLSRFVESRGGEGSATVSTGRGDAGGASYGLYQMTSKTTDKRGRSTIGGTVSNFIGGSKWAKEFEGLTPGTPEYTKKWKEIATGPQAKEFEAAQHQYIKQTHYDPAMQRLQKEGIDLSGRGMAVKNVMWQASVGAGAKGGSNIVRNALKGKDMAGMSDKDVINAIYDEMGKPGEGGQGLAYYGKNTAKVQEGVKRNLERAREAALAMEAGGGKGQPGQPGERPTTRLDQDVRMADTKKGMEQSAEIEGAKMASMKPMPLPATHQGGRTGGPDNANKYHGVGDPDLAALNSNWPMFDSV